MAFWLQSLLACRKGPKAATAQIKELGGSCFEARQSIPHSPLLTLTKLQHRQWRDLLTEVRGCTHDRLAAAAVEAQRNADRAGRADR